jgi:hypothetical protein
MFAALPPALQQTFRDYTAGVNARIQHVLLSPLELPGEYVATATIPQPWTVRDSVAIGVYLARTIPTNADPEDLELANMRAVQLSGVKALQALVPLRTRGSITTVPRANGAFPSQPGRTGHQERAALKRSAAFVSRLPFPITSVDGTPLSSRTAPDLQPRRLLGPGGSYVFAVRRRSDRHALLLAWNGAYAQTGSDGKVDPGVAAWQEFLKAAASIATGPLGPGAQLLSTRTCSTTSTRATTRARPTITSTPPTYRATASAS